MIKIATVYDNYKFNPEMKTGWGFSCVVKADKTILFDTGSDAETLFENLKKVDINPRDIQIIFLSHLHSDHTGGFEGFLEENPNVIVYIPKSFPSNFKSLIIKYGANFVEVSKFLKITETTYSTGELGSYIKEQSLLVFTKKGIVVITGCAHPGIVDILEKVKKILDEKIYLVMGGFHLLNASNLTLLSIISRFKKLGISKIAPSHCSGDIARVLFKQEYGENFIENGAGKIIEI